MASSGTFNQIPGRHSEGKVPGDYLFFSGFSPPGSPSPSPRRGFLPRLFSAEVSEEGLKGGGAGLTNLRGSGPIQEALSAGFPLLFPRHSSADFFTPVKAL